MVNYPFGELSIPENLVVTSAYSVRPSVRTLFWGDGRESGASPSGGGVCYKSCEVFFLRFSRREIAQEMEWPSRRVQKLVYFVFKYFNHNDPSTQFLANCFENIVMVTGNSGFNSTYVFACELRATGKRNKRKGIEQQ